MVLAVGLNVRDPSIQTKPALGYLDPWGKFWDLGLRLCDSRLSRRRTAPEAYGKSTSTQYGLRSSGSE